MDETSASTYIGERKLGPRDENKPSKPTSLIVVLGLGISFKDSGLDTEEDLAMFNLLVQTSWTSMGNWAFLR